MAFFAVGCGGSWAAGYLRGRLGTDLIDDRRFNPGYAPASWTGLTDHLRALGATDSELLAAGLASTSLTGRLIDRFRDRLILPIQAGDELVAFIGRRHPDAPDAGPKYLSTSDTDLFSKGAQLFGMTEGARELTAGATPVLVEGPLDAIAITLAAGGTAVGVAPLGTALTDRQADQLRRYLGAGNPGVIVATDADAAGQRAAVRAYWQLTCRGGNPRHLIMADGQDPAGLLQAAGPEALRDALATAPTLARTLIDARIAQYTDRMQHVEGPLLAVQSAAEVIGALAPEHWLEHITYLNTLVQISPGQSHLAVLDAGHAWTHDPNGLTRKHLAEPAVPTAHRQGGQRPRRTSHVPTGLAAPDTQAAGGPVDDAPGPVATAPDGADPGSSKRPRRLSRSPEPSPPDSPAGDQLIVEQWAADVWVDVGLALSV